MWKDDQQENNQDQQFTETTTAAIPSTAMSIPNKMEDDEVDNHVCCRRRRQSSGRRVRFHLQPSGVSDAVASSCSPLSPPATVVQVTEYSIPSRSEFSTQEILDAWWSAQEYKSVQLGAQFTVKQIRTNDPGSADCMEHTFLLAVKAAAAASSSTATEHDNDESLFASLLQTPTTAHIGYSLSNKCDTLQQLQSKLEATERFVLESWCTSKLSTRGLERYATKEHNHKRLEVLEQTRRTVVSMSSSKQYTELQMARAYHAQCRYAQLFARFLGEADARMAQGLRETAAVTMHHQYTGAPISSTTPFTTPVPLSEPCVSSSSSSYLTMTESVSPMVGVTVTPAVRERLSLSSKFMKRCLSPAMHRRCDMRFLESEEEENEKKDKEDVIQLSPSPPTKSLKSSRHSPKESHGRQQKKNYTLTIPPLSLDELDESVEPTISRFASSRLARSFKSSNSKRHLLRRGASERLLSKKTTSTTTRTTTRTAEFHSTQSKECQRTPMTLDRQESFKRYRDQHHSRRERTVAAHLDRHHDGIRLGQDHMSWSGKDTERSGAEKTNTTASSNSNNSYSLHCPVPSRFRLGERQLSLPNLVVVSPLPIIA